MKYLVKFFVVTFLLLICTHVSAEQKVVFLDTANVWKVDYNDTIDDTNKIRSSFGISANMFTTVGPLSFTFAQDITKSTNDETESFNFRLGTSF